MKLLTYAVLSSALSFLQISTSSAQTSKFNLPDLGDSSVSAISPTQEIIIGKRFMQQAYGSLAYIIDPELQAYIKGLGESLTKSLSNNNVDFQYYLVNAPVINAFAVPGGHITLFSGLITASKDENELVSVMAHEITHVTQKHLPRLIAQSKQSTIPTVAGILAGVLIGGQAGAAAIVSSQAASIQNQLSYNRAFESEADSLGMQLMANAGYDTYGMTRFFGILQSNSRIGESSAPEYLRTHPLTLNRISEAEIRAKNYPKTSHPSSKDYYFMREKVRAYSSDNNKQRLVEDFKSRVDDGSTYTDAIRLGYAYALMNNQQYDLALQQADILLKQDSNHPYFNNVKAQIYAQKGDFQNAMNILSEAIKRAPNNDALKKDYGDILIKAGKSQEGINVLKPYLDKSLENSYIHRLVAQGYGNLGDNFNSQINLADYYSLRGLYDQALSNLEVARRDVGNSFYKESLIDGKSKAIIQEKELMENAKL